MADKSVRLNIKRQDTPQSQPYWEEFEQRWRPGMNVISALMAIAMDPVDRHGKPTMVKECHFVIRNKTERVLTMIRIDDYGERTGDIEGLLSRVEQKLGRAVKK